jgi:hypothetical protein
MGGIPFGILCLALLLCTLGCIAQAHGMDQHDLYWVSGDGDGMGDRCDADYSRDLLSLDELQELMTNAIQSQWAEFTATEDKFREIIERELQQWQSDSASR